ncbi:PREDICTED: uncharacterized protein LOC109479747 [Branchiostoma belcheri]|uniref:Uncharacterized protein LOC109479747 n=1 Tax=Branchiostoma belcheri TaxID=7741 RepID=A0A6P4Z7B1_BRABE|nr:PREDICTED: uncharacterized protein LOC109479747 [Branchiostoma belcheri]
MDKRSRSGVPMTPAQLRRLARAETKATGADNITSKVQTLDLKSDSAPSAILCYQKVVLKVEFFSRTVCLGQADPLACYVSSLVREHRWFSLTRDNTYALADCDLRGRTKDRQFQLVQAVNFETAAGESYVLFLCSCDEAREQHERLSATSCVVTGEDIRDFAVREEGLYCLHARAAKHIIATPLSVEVEGDEEREDGPVEQLQTEPFIAAAHDGDTYGILKRMGDGGKLCCVSCSGRQKSCAHVSAYKEWCRDRNVDSNLVLTVSSEPRFESVSTSPVPYPFTQEMREKFHRYVHHTETFPQNLVPDVPAGACRHGHDWDDRDPVAQEWIQHVGVCIYTRYATITDYYAGPDGQQPRVVFYRPTVGDCGCRHMYDGSADLLHNIDNRHMIFYGLLVDYLHSMVEGRQPLKTMERVCNRTRSVCDLDNFKGIPYGILRQGWNTWARRLDIDWKKPMSVAKDAGIC